MDTSTSIINNIYIFGSLKDGFNCFPLSNKFAHFYNSAAKDWIFNARKYKNTITYVYVEYGLLTSLKNGRKGSCIGIAIEFDNHYFSDPTLLCQRILGEAIETMVEEEKVIKKNSLGQIGFVPYSLSDIKPTLEEWSTKIKGVIYDKFKDKIVFIEGNLNFPNEGKTVAGLHPNSNPLVIQEAFKIFGGFDLGPQYPVQDLTFAEIEKIKEAQRKKVLQEKKKEEYELLKGDVLRLRRTNSELLDTIKEKEDTIKEKEDTIKELRKQLKNPSHSENKKPLNFFASLFKRENTLISNRENFGLNKILKLLFSIIIGAGIVLVVYLFSLPDTIKKAAKSFPENKKKELTEHLDQPTDELKGQQNTSSTVQFTDQGENEVNIKKGIYDDGIITPSNSKKGGLLRVKVFLKHAKDNNRPISTFQEFQEDLIDYLMNKSSVVQAHYDSKDELRQFIYEENPTNTQKIKDHIADKVAEQDVVYYDDNRDWVNAIAKDESNKKTVGFLVLKIE